MRIPALRGIIDRRVLVNYRVNPDVLQAVLPPPFHPKLVRGFGPQLTRSAHCIFHPGVGRAVAEFLRHETEAVRAGLSALWRDSGFKSGTERAVARIQPRD